MERMLVFAPHVDDAEFGLGGWLHRAIRKSMGTVRIDVLTCGGYTRSDGMYVANETREREAAAAFKRLGVANYGFSGMLSEGGQQNASYAQLVAHIEREIREFQATEVFLPLPSFNQDHRTVHDACVTALRPGMFASHLKHVWAYEYPGNAWGSERPTYGRAYLGLEPIDVEAKMVALACHRSQFEGRKVAVGPLAARHMLTQRGSEVGLDAAECVYLLREVFP